LDHKTETVREVPQRQSVNEFQADGPT